MTREEAIKHGKKQLEYYMVFDDEGSGYGAYETFDEAMESLKTHNDIYNSSGRYNYTHIVKVVEIRDEVYRISGKEKANEQRNRDKG